MKKIIALTVLLLCAVISSAQVKKQALNVPWPTEYKFKVGSDEVLDNMHVVQSIPENEDSNKWTLLKNTTVINNMTGNTPAKIIELYKKSAHEQSAYANFTVIKTSNPKVKNAWVLFKVEIPRFHYDPQPQSELYYVIQGEKQLFVNSVAIKAPTLDQAFTDKWSKVFMASKLIYQ